MGNQQGKANDIDLAWLAGFIDGEGSFMVLQLAGKRLAGMDRKYMTPRIAIANTDFPTLDTVKAILTAVPLPFHVRESAGGLTLKGNQEKDKWHLTVQGLRRCKRWCEIFIPYLRTKRDQAETMLELCDMRLARPNIGRMGEWYSDEELALGERLRNRKSWHPQRLHARTAS